MTHFLVQKNLNETISGQRLKEVEMVRELRQKWARGAWWLRSCESKASVTLTICSEHQL